MISKSATRLNGGLTGPWGTRRMAALRWFELLKSVPSGVITMSTMRNASGDTAGDGGAV